MSVLSDRLKELRGPSSQSEMARTLGIARQQWIKYETGQSAPGAEILSHICRVHNCSADWLLGLPPRGGSATARGDGAIAAAGSNIHIEVGKDDKPGEMKVCAKCPKVAALQTTLATILQAAKSGAAKLPRKR